MDISEAEIDEHCYLNTVKDRKTTVSIFYQTRAQAVRVLQERCGFPSDVNFINALECNPIDRVHFGRRDMKIANKIYGYSKGAARGRFKHPQKGVKMDRTTEYVAIPLPPKILKHYKDIHLDIDILYVNQTAFLFAISRNIGFIHCRLMSRSVTKKIQNTMKKITLDYQARGFKVVTVSGDGEFEHLKDLI